MGVKMLGSKEQGGKNVREQGAYLINLGSREQRSRIGIVGYRPGIAEITVLVYYAIRFDSLNTTFRALSVMLHR